MFLKYTYNELALIIWVFFFYGDGFALGKVGIVFEFTGTLLFGGYS